MKKYEADEGVFVQLEPGDLPSSAYTHRLPIGRKARGYRSKVTIEIMRAAVEMLGEHGRLLGMSKTTYGREHPGHRVYFNACIFDGRRLRPRARHKARQIWFGDLDLTLEMDKLQRLADRIGHPIIITPETPYRFKGLPKRPRHLEKLGEIYIVRPDRPAPAVPPVSL